MASQSIWKFQLALIGIIGLVTMVASVACLDDTECADIQYTPIVTSGELGEDWHARNLCNWSKANKACDKCCKKYNKKYSYLTGKPTEHCECTEKFVERLFGKPKPKV